MRLEDDSFRLYSVQCGLEWTYHFGQPRHEWIEIQGPQAQGDIYSGACYGEYPGMLISGTFWERLDIFFSVKLNVFQLLIAALRT